MGVTQYIGSRYVPIFADPIEHSTAKTYEPLTIVLHEGNSYTSKQFVPKGIQITNEAYWAETGNYNAQVEAYRREALQAQNDIDVLLPKSEFAANNTVLNRIEKDIRNFDNVIDMQNNNNLHVGMICHTNGFYASGDNGAAYYVISNNGVANNTDVIECINDLYAVTVVTDFYVTPEMFGAYGDNTHDDTDAFATMFSKNKNIVLRKDATYLLNSSGQNKIFVLKNNMQINLNGATIVSNYKYTFRNFDVSEDSFVTRYKGNGNISISNGTIKYACFTFNHADGINISNVNFVDSAALHAIQVGGCKNVVIEDCNFKGLLYGGSGVPDCINIECMDYTGQPYFDSNARTYDLTPTVDTTVRNCRFTPDSSNSTYNYMGDGVGTHYVPMNDQVIACEPFDNIKVIGNYIEANGKYAIRCNNWKNSVIADNVFTSDYGIQMATQYMSNYDVKITGNQHIGADDTYNLLMFKSGKNEKISLFDNISKHPNRHNMVRWNAMDGSDEVGQGIVSFAKVDGVYLVNNDGLIAQQASNTYVLNDALSFDNFSKLIVFCGVVGYGTFVAVPIYSYSNQTINPSGNIGGVATNLNDTVVKIVVQDNHTLVVSNYTNVGIRAVMAFL